MLSDTLSEVKLADLTLLRDPVDIWPDPADCPDWPLSSGGDRRGVRVGREDAEARLAALRDLLNPRGMALRNPTEAEIAEALEKHFHALAPGEWGGSARRAQRLGFDGYRPILKDRVAPSIMEAIHIRGYLRKLDAEEEADERAGQIAQDRPHRRALDAYEAESKLLLPELESLLEAEARHLRAEADKKAWQRAEEIRRTLRARHSQAESAAHALNVKPPEAPTMGS